MRGPTWRAGEPGARSDLRYADKPKTVEQLTTTAVRRILRQDGALGTRMAEPLSARVARVRRLIDAARRIADAGDPLGQRARRELPAATGLSPQSVELGLTQHLETRVTDAELSALCESLPEAPRAHVLLAANVFVAPLRAIALALAQSPRVEVRSSRRQPVMTALLADGSDGAFRMVDELTPSGGDHVWAYGSNETLSQLRGELPAGVVFHGHGAGYGVVVIEARTADSIDDLAMQVAKDVVPFDQRGCLSPRLVLLAGSDDAARAFATALAKALSALHHDVPRGDLSREEAADLARYRDTMLYAAEVLHAGLGVVGLDLEGTLLLPPVGRNVHVTRVADVVTALESLGPEVTAVGVSVSDSLSVRIGDALPGARRSALGQMQRPPLDGPVDRRPATAARVL